MAEDAFIQPQTPSDFNETPSVSVMVGGVKTSREFAENAGKIHEIVKDKAVSAKRKVNAALANRLNTHNWKHGRFSKYRPLPKYFFEYAEYVASDLNLNDRNQMFEIIDGLIKKNLIRIEANYIFELADGGVQDKNLSTLMKDTAYLIAFRHTLANPVKIGVAQFNQFNFQESRDTAEEDDNKPLQIIREALKILRG